jgi:hypothetical protein
MKKKMSLLKLSNNELKDLSAGDFAANQRTCICRTEPNTATISNDNCYCLCPDNYSTSSNRIVSLPVIP